MLHDPVTALCIAWFMGQRRIVGILATLRVPFVQLRLLIETPALWGLALAAAVLFGLAGLHDRRDRNGDRSAPLIEALACGFGVATWLWLLHGGQFPWTEGDWREEWTFFFAWKQALRDGTMPYHLGTAMQGTERYFANLQTPMMPYVAGLALVSVKTFLLFHIVVVYIAGFLGAIALRRELAIGLLPWMLFVFIFTLNGHIISHLSVGHLPWIAYFLMPWVLWSAVRTARGDSSARNVITCATVLAAMILIGGWHVFVWSLIFMIGTCLARPAQVVVLVQIVVLTTLLAAVRLAPGVATFGTGANTFISGFPTLASLFESLAGTPVRHLLLDQWELDMYVGGAGLMLLGIGAVPFREVEKRHMNVLLLPSAALIILSFGDVYRDTLFRLPGFVSERVTTRLLIVPVLWLALAGAVRFDAWWRHQGSALALGLWVGGWFLALQLLLRAHSWRPHTGPSADLLPAEVLKTLPPEPAYYRAFWIGAAISLATALAVAAFAYRRRPFWN